MKRGGVGALLAGAAQWWAVSTVLFFLTFPLWGRALVDVLRFVLEALDSFGSA